MQQELSVSAAGSAAALIKAMLFRRISKHVKDQNWFAVGIDFAIVVVGVVLGIEVANWSDARADTRLGATYVRQLVEDLETDLANSAAMASYHAVVLENVVAATKLLANPKSDDKALVVAAYRASEITNNPANRETWDQIVSAGHLGLLPQAAFDQGIANYYSIAGANDTSTYLLESSDYRKAVRTVIPLAVQLAIREHCSDEMNENGFIVGFVGDCNLDGIADELPATATALRASASIRQHLPYQYSLVAIVYANHEQDTLLVKQLLAALNAE
ncbi:MAG: hypothetical protein AAGH76_00495 [Pseudomonadota bacterium]